MELKEDDLTSDGGASLWERERGAEGGRGGTRPSEAVVRGAEGRRGGCRPSEVVVGYTRVPSWWERERGTRPVHVMGMNNLTDTGGV